jgi:hypothetical protein
MGKYWNVLCCRTLCVSQEFYGLMGLVVAPGCPGLSLQYSLLYIWGNGFIVLLSDTN